MGEHREVSRRKDEPGLNPAAPSRRRLLKAAGLGAIAGFTSLDWRSPVIRVGSVPAFAQGSPACSEAAIGFSATDGTATWVVVEGGTSTVFSEPFTGTFESLVYPSGNSTTYTYQGTVYRATGVGATYSVRQTCCTWSFPLQVATPVSTDTVSTRVAPIPYLYLFDDEGECVPQIPE